jgi:enamine deaminase RidA (YjgF/YER057c/UK114 family)
MNRVLGIAAVPTMLCAALMAIYPAFVQVSKSEATRDNPEYFPVPRTAGTALPFSEAVKVGDLLYVAGQIGSMPGTLTLAAGGIGPETHQALDNIKAILDRHGSFLEQIINALCSWRTSRIGPPSTRFMLNISKRAFWPEARWRRAVWL